MHIDEVDFFCNDWNQDIILSHYYLVFLHGVNDPDRRGFYYTSLDTNNTMVLYACKEVPSGCLQVFCLEFMYIFHDTCTNFNFLSVEECRQAKLYTMIGKRMYSLTKQLE